MSVYNEGAQFLVLCSLNQITLLVNFCEIYVGSQVRSDLFKVFMPFLINGVISRWTTGKTLDEPPLRRGWLAAATLMGAVSNPGIVHK